MLPCSPHRPRRRGDRQTRALTDALQDGFLHYGPSDLSRTDCFPDHKPIRRHSSNAPTSFPQHTHVIPAKAGIQRPNIRGVLSAYPRHDKSSETFVLDCRTIAPDCKPISSSCSRNNAIPPTVLPPDRKPIRRHSRNTPTSFQRRRESIGLPGCIRVPVSLGDVNRGSTKLGGGSH